MKTQQIPINKNKGTNNLTQSNSKSIKCLFSSSHVENGHEIIELNYTVTMDNGISRYSNMSEALTQGYVYNIDNSVLNDYKYAVINTIIKSCDIDRSAIKLGRVKPNDKYECLYYNIEDNWACFAWVDENGDYCAITEAKEYESPYCRDNNNHMMIIVTDKDGFVLNNMILRSVSLEELLCIGPEGKLTVLNKDSADGYDKYDFIDTKEVVCLKSLNIKYDCDGHALDHPVTCIVKKDVFLSYGATDNRECTFILDGGNLYRYQKPFATPDKIVCKKGSFIDIVPDSYWVTHNDVLGADFTIIKRAGIETSLVLYGPQCNVVVEFNPMDFVKREDYIIQNSASCINLNKVLERIFTSLYNRNKQNQRMVIKMPETHYGHTNFFLERPVVIPYNVTLDMSGATVFVPKEFENMIREKNANGIDIRDENGMLEGYNVEVNYVFAFGTNSVYPILATSVIKNVEIKFEKECLKNVSKIFDLTNFAGIMENVDIDLGNRTDMIAFWQPFGTPSIAYSDQKIIKRCKIINYGWRNETPTAIFCYGDGCIIEQCNLGYVAIICGKSYTIRGCLNDSYLLFDTTVDFSGSYWEVGQFQILDSKVTFENCMLNAQNNHFEISHPDNLRRYMGPWMTIDTDGCRQRLLNIVIKHGIGLDRMNDITTGKVVHVIDDESNIKEERRWDRTYGGRFMGRATSQFSTVSFDPSIRTCLVYWGYRQPMSGPLFKVGLRARIIGLENLESLNEIFIHNNISLNESTGEPLNPAPEKITVPINQPSTIPLVNGEFYPICTDVIVPEDVIVTSNKFNSGLVGKEKMAGLDWSGQRFLKAHARFVLDEKRKIYSRSYLCTTTFVPKYGEQISYDMYVDFSKGEYRNLKVELFVEMMDMVGIVYTYLFRNHFNRVVDGDVLCFGRESENGIITDNIVPVKNQLVNIASFRIARAYFDKIAMEAQVAVEHVECTEDLPKPSSLALCDYWGNIYEPLSCVYETVNVANKLQWLNSSNIRVYMDVMPMIGTWIDGDEVVLANAAYRYFDGNWYEYMAFNNETLKPVEPGQPKLSERSM